jgi:hypothetical protein
MSRKAILPPRRWSVEGGTENRIGASINAHFGMMRFSYMIRVTLSTEIYSTRLLREMPTRSQAKDVPAREFFNQRHIVANLIRSEGSAVV